MPPSPGRPRVTRSTAAHRLSLRREERAEGCAPRSELRGRCRVDMSAARPVCQAGHSVSHVAASRTGASSDRLWLSGGSDGRPQAHDSRCPHSCSRLRAAHRAGGETQLRAGREEAAVRALLRGVKRFAARRRVAGTTPAPRTSDVEWRPRLRRSHCPAHAPRWRLPDADSLCPSGTVTRETHGTVGGFAWR